MSFTFYVRILFNFFGIFVFQVDLSTVVNWWKLVWTQNVMMMLEKFDAGAVSICKAFKEIFLTRNDAIVSFLYLFFSQEASSKKHCFKFNWFEFNSCGRDESIANVVQSCFFLSLVQTLCIVTSRNSLKTKEEKKYVSKNTPMTHDDCSGLFWCLLCAVSAQLLQQYTPRLVGILCAHFHSIKSD